MGSSPGRVKTKDYKIDICYFTAKHAALRRKIKDLLARIQNNVSEWSDLLSADCCFSELALYNSACWSSTKRISSSSHRKPYLPFQVKWLFPYDNFYLCLISIDALFNLVFTSGIYPSKWSSAYLCPIFKSSDPSKPENL